MTCVTTRGQEERFGGVRRTRGGDEVVAVTGTSAVSAGTNTRLDVRLELYKVKLPS